LELPEKAKDIQQLFGAYSITDFLWSSALVLVALLAGRLVAMAATRMLLKASKRTESRVDDILTHHLAAPANWLIPVIALRTVVPLLSIPVELAAGLSHFLLLVSVMCAGWALLSLINAGAEIVAERFDVQVEDNLRARAVHTQVRGLRNIAKFIIVVLTVAAALMTFDGVRALGAGLLASTGVLGVILGFAAQRSIATVIAGIQIALAQPIRVSDVVIVENEWGIIEEVTLTYVVVRIWDLRRLIVPISYFVERPFQNWTRSSADLLGTVELRLDYSVPLAPLREELQRIASASELWDKKVCGIQVTDCTERTMLVRCLVSSKDASALWDLRCLVREGLLAFVQSNHAEALPRLRGELVTKAPLAAD
jgi:small-conductance mechanosensitive channel